MEEIMSYNEALAHRAMTLVKADRHNCALAPAVPFCVERLIAFEREHSDWSEFVWEDVEQAMRDAAARTECTSHRALRLINAIRAESHWTHRARIGMGAIIDRWLRQETTVDDLAKLQQILDTIRSEA